MSRLKYKNYKGIKLYARGLRKKPTPSEDLLWQLLRNRKFDGYRFLRQHPVFYRIDKNWVDYYIPDFYCSKLQLIIELDGPIHEFSTERDHERDLKLKERGYNVLRIKNEELENVNVVISKIKDFIYKNPPPSQ